MDLKRNYEMYLRGPCVVRMHSTIKIKGDVCANLGVLWCLITDAKKYAFNTKFYGYIALRSFY